MAPPEIIRKLQAELEKGITTEPQVVYLMAAVRKLIEQYGARNQYEYLTFYCDWALHSKLDRSTSQKILRLFDAATIHLQKGVKLRDLPPQLSKEVRRISHMSDFEEQLSEFLEANGLPTLEATRIDGWTHFLHLYAGVVQDCPLVMADKNRSAIIAKVTVHLELATKPVEDDMMFKVTWTIDDKSGRSGEIFVTHSFSLNPL